MILRIFGTLSYILGSDGFNIFDFELLERGVWGFEMIWRVEHEWVDEREMSQNIMRQSGDESAFIVIFW